MSIHIPRIDLSNLGTPDSNDTLVYACEEFGFFQIVNHGIPKARCDAFVSTMKQFFRLPSAEKQALMRTAKNAWGFYDNELTKNKKDWKEVFDFGVDQLDDEYPTISQWPQKMSGFKETMLDWFRSCETLSSMLLNEIVGTLSDERDQLNHFFSPDNSSFVRLNYYPLCDDPADSTQDTPSTGHLGVSHHTDAGVLTVLIQDNVSGLQIKSEGQWHTVHVERDALIVNIGDLMQVWSNGRYKAALHRVKANEDEERFSAPFFYNPVYSCNCLPIKTNEKPRYRSVNWKEFRKARTDGDYADIGKESQISDYLID
jgi:isopenicillin N synthase-like dioxygenase